MDKPLYIIEPYQHGTDFWLVTTLLIAALSFVGTLYFRRNTKMEYNRRNSVAMILSFFAVIALGVSAMRFYSKWKIQPIEIYNNRIKTPYGEAPLSNVIDFYIKLEKKYKPMQTEIVQDSAHYFFLIERNNKTHVLSEGDYPIKEVLDKLNETMGYKSDGQ